MTNKIDNLLNNINNNITLVFPSNEKLLIIPRLLISGLLSDYDINIENIEDIKLIIQEAISLLLTDQNNNIKLELKWTKQETKLIINITISSNDKNNLIINNLMKNGLRIQLLNYLCDKFILENQNNLYNIFIEKSIDFI